MLCTAMDTDAFLATALRNPVNEAIAEELLRRALPDAWIVSGCLVQICWNMKTGRAVDHGINDYDIFYFDPDTSWQAEDAVIRHLQARLGHLEVKIEVRNQARVHLWYPQKHGLPYPALHCSADGFDQFLTKTPRSESAVREMITTSTRQTALTTSPTWLCGPIPEQIFRRPNTRRRPRAGRSFGRKSRCSPPTSRRIRRHPSARAR